MYTKWPGAVYLTDTAAHTQHFINRQQCYEFSLAVDVRQIHNAASSLPCLCGVIGKLGQGLCLSNSDADGQTGILHTACFSSCPNSSRTRQLRPPGQVTKGLVD
ncbi:hypothetical protein ENASMM143B3_20990 [Enterobacter asburiae]